MRLGKRRYWLTRLAGVAAAIFSCILCAGMTFGLIPPTDILARLYLNAAVDKNADIVVFLVGTDTTCTNYVREDIQKDIQKYGGAEIRNLMIEVAYNTGSDEGLQFALLEFEYRQSDQHEWQHGEMRVMTDHSAFGFRYLCGNILAGKK